MAFEPVLYNWCDDQENVKLCKWISRPYGNTQFHSWIMPASTNHPDPIIKEKKIDRET